MLQPKIPMRFAILHAEGIGDLERLSDRQALSGVKSLAALRSLHKIPKALVLFDRAMEGQIRMRRISRGIGTEQLPRELRDKLTEEAKGKNQGRRKTAPEKRLNENEKRNRKFVSDRREISSPGSQCPRFIQSFLSQSGPRRSADRIEAFMAVLMVSDHLF
jgi:hypothetical protein